MLTQTDLTKLIKLLKQADSLTLLFRLSYAFVIWGAVAWLKTGQFFGILIGVYLVVWILLNEFVFWKRLYQGRKLETERQRLCEQLDTRRKTRVMVLVDRSLDDNEILTESEIGDIVAAHMFLSLSEDETLRLTHCLHKVTQSSINDITSSDEYFRRFHCKFHARSPYLKCAVNPTIKCKDCSDFEAQ